MGALLLLIVAWAVFSGNNGQRDTNCREKEILLKKRINDRYGYLHFSVLRTVLNTMNQHSNAAQSPESETPKCYSDFVRKLDQKQGGKTISSFQIDEKAVDSLVKQFLPVYKIYLENSSSMDGYVSGETQFEKSIFSLISNVAIGKGYKNIELYFVSERVKKIEGIDPGSDEFEENLARFFSGLDQKIFKEAGRGYTNLSDIVGHVFNEQKKDENTISILVSDFIFAPRTKKPSEDFINAQSEKLKMTFAKEIEKSNIATLVLRLESEFNGVYYPANYHADKKTRQLEKKRRPFYLWIMGKPTSLYGLKTAINKMTDKNKEVPVYKLFLYGKVQDEIRYRILPYTDAAGRFRIDRDIGRERDGETVYYGIKDVEADKGTNRIAFSMAVDLSSFSYLDSRYIADAANYDVSSQDYRIESVHAIDRSQLETVVDRRDRKLLQKGTYTHKIVISSVTDYVSEEVLDIALKRRAGLPKWVARFSSENDNSISNYDREELRKTWKIQNIVGAVFEAYQAKSWNHQRQQPKPFFSLSISIRR